MEINIGKAGKAITCDFSTLPEQSQAYIIAYGLRQALNDAHASITEKAVPNVDERAEQAFEAAVSRWEDLLAGNPPTVGARAQKDEVTTVALQIAREKVMAAAKAQRKPWRSIPKDKREAAVEMYFTKNREVLLAEAKTRLSAVDGADVLAGLDL